MDKLTLQGDNPKPRFGHTISLVSRTKAILFGGAIGDSTKYSITNDVYSLDLPSLSWRRLTPQGNGPSVRAAHASCSVELYQVLIFGGATGGGGLSSDELFLLDLKAGDDKALWVPVEAKGPTPGPRYGHSLVFIKPHIVVFGGNSGNESLNDVWLMNLEKSPYSWFLVEDRGRVVERPPARVYHAAGVCNAGAANGMMVVFGGRSNDQKELNDSWGLRKHRDGSWDWVKAPYKNGDKIMPKGRYQHSINFSGTLMLVVGGRNNQAGENLPLEVYDTDTSEWFRFFEVPNFRHSCFNQDSDLFIFGGFEPVNPNQPTAKFIHVDLLVLLEKNQNLITTSGFAGVMVNSKKNGKKTLTEQVLNDLKKPKEEPPPKVSPQKGIRIAPLAVIATVYGPNDNFNDIVRKIPIENLQEESKKMGGIQPIQIDSFRVKGNDEIANYFLNLLLAQKSLPGKPPKLSKDMIIKLCDATQLIFTSEPTLLNIRGPCKIFGNLNGQFDDLMKLFEHFGYPEETLRGDIESHDYLFLGDYVDRGNRSLELICLLFALKIKYPEQFHMIRGHHEDRTVNRVLGFAEECEGKMGEDSKSGNSIFCRVNLVFDCLPLAAVVERKLFCVHGGIGQNVLNLKQIDKIPKPIEVCHDINQISRDQILLNELLWTDPAQNPPNETENNRGFFGCETIRSNKFSMERITNFLLNNGLAMLIRSHEFVKDGYENIDNKLITFGSCLDYCGKLKNAGGIIYVKKNSEIYPKMIIPGVNLDAEEIKWMALKEKNFSAKENKIRRNPSPLRN